MNIFSRFFVIALCVMCASPTPAHAIATIVRDDVESMAFFNLLQNDISTNGGLSVPTCPAGASGQGAGKCQSVPGGNVYGLFSGNVGGDKFLAYNGYASLDRACMAAFGPTWTNDHAATSYNVRSYASNHTVMYWNGTRWDTFVAKTDTHTTRLVCVSSALPDNIAPLANAGADSTILLPTSSITPSGQSATDSDGSIAKYVWTRVGGTGTSTILITNGTTLTPTLSRMSAIGTYIYRLTVTDNWGLTASDDMMVSVSGNIAPVVNAGVDRTITLPTNSSAPSGQSITDPGGSIAKRTWTRAGGTGTSVANISGVTSLTPTFTGMSTAGTYIFRLTATDNGNLTSYDEMTVTVLATGTPTANAGTDLTINLPTSSVNPFGQSTVGATSYSWSRTGGTGVATPIITNATTLNPTFTGMTSPGTYIFRLTATNTKGSATDDMIVTVKNINTVPTVSAGVDRSLTLPTSSVIPSGQSASDSDGSISSYVWTYISGPVTSTITNATSLNPTFNGLVLAGTYVFRLTVTDNGNLIASDDMTVIVANAIAADLESAALPANVVTPTIAKVGTLTPFAMQVRNTGVVTTGTSFTNRLRKANDSSGAPDVTSAVSVAVNTTGPLAPGAITNGFNIMYAPLATDVGTKWFSICADENMSALGIITEINELNNCGEWTQVTITDNFGPTVNAGVDIVLDTIVGYITSPSGQSASDSDGTIVKYLWTYVGGIGTGVPTINSATTLNPSLTFAASDGTYIFRLTVTDNDGATAFDEMTVTRATLYPTVTGVTISSPSIIPDGTTQYTIRVTGESHAGGENVMDLSASIRSPYGIASYQRGKIHYSSLSVAGTPLPCPEVDAAGRVINTVGTRVVELDALANQYMTLHTCTTTVQGNARVADFVVSFKPSFTTPLTNNEIEGIVADKQFRISNTTTSNIHTFFSLTLPTASFTSTPRCTISLGENGCDSSISWSSTNVASVKLTNSSELVYTTTSSGSQTSSVRIPFNSTTYQIRDTSSDAVLAFVSGTAVCAVGTAWDGSVCAATNVAPLANAGSDFTINLPATSATPSGQNASDADGNIASYQWTFVPGGTGASSPTVASSTILNPTFNGMVAVGSYIFRLTVTDNGGLTTKDDMTVTVTIAGNVAPIANAGADITRNSLITDVTPSGQSASDSDGSIVKYSWTRVGGTALMNVSWPNISNSNTLNPTIGSVFTNGTHIYRLTVTDNGGLSASDDMTVTVAAPEPTVTSATISSPVVIPDGVTEYTISVTSESNRISNPTGENIRIQYASINKFGQQRGEIHYVIDTAFLVPLIYNSGTVSCMGGGAAEYKQAYFNLRACSTTVQGNARTTNFIVSFNPLYTTPLTNNNIYSTAFDGNTSASGIGFDNNFALYLPPTIALAGGNNAASVNAADSRGITGFIRNMLASALQSVKNLFDI